MDHYIEPYAGGASVALYLLLNDHVKRVTINDLDKSIYAFWHAVRYDNNKLCNRIENTSITIENWKAAKEVQKNKSTASLFELGFSTFFLNRTNYSGVLKGGVLGGRNQDGKDLIDCRFNKSDLIRRITEIDKKKSKIQVCNMDAVNLVKHAQQNSKSERTIYYFDPPYYLKGALLYMNYYNIHDHKTLANEIKKIKKAKWLVTYDNVPQISSNIYSFTPHKEEYTLYHTAGNMHKGKEIMIFSENIKRVPMKEFMAVST